jgi:hypothetical protein
MAILPEPMGGLHLRVAQTAAFLAAVVPTAGVPGCTSALQSPPGRPS